MKDTEINCKVTDCYWNIGEGGKANCARGEIDISDDHSCQNYITNEEAKYRLNVAAKKWREKNNERN